MLHRLWCYFFYANSSSNCFCCSLVWASILDPDQKLRSISSFWVHCLNSWKTVRVCKLQWMSHAQIFLIPQPPKQHTFHPVMETFQMVRKQKLNAKRFIKSNQMGEGESKEHDRRSSSCWSRVKWGCSLFNVSGLIIKKRKLSTSQKKEPIITFFGEGHLKTLYKDREKIERDQAEGRKRFRGYTQRIRGQIHTEVMHRTLTHHHHHHHHREKGEG